MRENKRILIVEDDEDIQMIEEVYLQSAGFITECVADGLQAEQIIHEKSFDLILLDWMLPKKSGYEVCKDIREKIDVPILMVIARTESIDKVKGLSFGADDYITKPFDPAELVARVRANLRQYERLSKKEEVQDEICVQDIRILLKSRKVYKKDEEIKLANKEFELLKFMAIEYSKVAEPLNP